MLSSFRRRLTFANVTSVIALCAALGGGAVAIGGVTTITSQRRSRQRSRTSLRSVSPCTVSLAMTSRRNLPSPPCVTTTLRGSEPRALR